MAKSKTSPLVIVLLIVGAVILLGVAIFGVVAAMGVFGMRKYISEAKSAEGKVGVATLAAGVVRCSETEAAGKSENALPESAPPVPPSFSDVSGKKYQSAPSEWSHAAYTCAGFNMGMPQYFQYEWQKLSPTNGKAIARADLDADGKPETVFEIEVTCSPNCRTGTLQGSASP